MKLRSKTATLAVMLSLVALLAGCVNLGGSKYVRGSVVFGDTGLPMIAEVRIGPKFVTTNTGRFVVDLEEGVYDYTVTTLLGTTSGTVAVQPGKGIVLRFPEFEGFSREEYNAFLMTESSNGSYYTTRWDRNKAIYVWIYPNEDIPEEAYDMVWQALYAWQEVLKDVIRFEQAKNASSADLTVRWGSDVSISHCRRSVDTKTGLIEWAEIEMTMIRPDVSYPYLHEVGHCIGLEHATNPDYVMNGSLLTPNHVAIHPEEADYARLLYSIPSKSPRI